MFDEVLIYKFNQFLLSLSYLHKWILEPWKLFIDGSIELFPCARCFLIAIFNTPKDKDLALHDRLWMLSEHSYSQIVVSFIQPYDRIS